MTTINEKSTGIKIEGHHGTWYVIDKAQNENGPVFLLEHEQYGDEAACLIVDSSGLILASDVYNGFDDLNNEEFDGCPHCGDGGCLACQPGWFL